MLGIIYSLVETVQASCSATSEGGQAYYMEVFYSGHLEHIYHHFLNCPNLYYLPKLSAVSPRGYVIFTAQAIDISQYPRKQTPEICSPFQDYILPV